MNRRGFFVGAAAAALRRSPPSSGRAETLAQDGVEWLRGVPSEGGSCLRGKRRVPNSGKYLQLGSTRGLQALR